MITTGATSTVDVKTPLFTLIAYEMSEEGQFEKDLKRFGLPPTAIFLSKT
jgi:hypothetical protein